MKTLSPIENMQKDRDSRKLKEQLSGLKEVEMKLTEKLEPLQDEVMAISQTISSKMEGLNAFLEK